MTSAPPKLGRGFEWFVAWRHLRDPERHSRRMLLVGVAILILSIAAMVVGHVLTKDSRSADGFLRARPTLFAENLWRGGVIGVIVGAVLTYLGILFAAFTVFTAISVFGVFLGTAAPIIALSVMSGFEADLKGKIRGAKADVVITAPDERAFTEWREVLTKIAPLPGVAGATPFIEAEIMVKSGGTPSGITLRGIDPRSAPGVLNLTAAMREGTIDQLTRPQPPPPPPGDGAPAEPPAVESNTMPGIILGEVLYAEVLRVYMGQEVDVVCPLCGLSPAGPRPKSRPFRVAGHFYSGMYEFDAKLAYVALENARRFLGMDDDEVTGIDVRTRTPEEAPALAAAIARALGKDYEVRSWEQLNKGLFMALRLEKIAMFVVLTFIALVASFSIVSNLIMLVTEKAREVAILKAMGAGDGAILRIFFAEGLYIGLLGLAVGVSSGILGCKLLERFGPPLPTDVYYISNLPVVMRADEIATVALSALLLCCLATVYPALLASRMRPVDGLRYE